jgi:hypothetical protein
MGSSQNYSATVAANGTATATIVTGSRRRRWTVSQVSVEMSAAPIGATCALRLNGVLVTPLVPTGDAAGGDPPVTLEGTDVLTVAWAGCTPGQVGSVLALYDEQAL